MCTEFRCPLEPVARLTAFLGVQVIDRGSFCQGHLEEHEKLAINGSDAKPAATFYTIRRFTPPVPVQAMAVGTVAA